jgi:WD40 repeat protein
MVGFFLIPFFVLNFNLVKKWYSIETTHFVLYYYDGLEDFAQRSAQFLEEKAYNHVVNTLKNPLDRKTHIVFLDVDDIGNGFAIEIFDQIVIFAADIYYVPLRGRHPWLQDVLTHEFSHIVALRKAKKTSRYVPTVFISGGLFCGIGKGNLCSISLSERQATLVGGFGFGLPPYSEPAYFTEGIAQLVTAELGHDALDSYRNMILRTLLYHKKIYPLKYLWNFEAKQAWQGEIVYNHGFSFLYFIKENYGWDAILRTIDCASGVLTFSYESCFEKATGEKFYQLEDKWKNWLYITYQEQISRFEQSQGKLQGKLLKLEKQKVGLYERNVYSVSLPKYYGNGFFVIQDGTLMYYEGDKKPQKIFGRVNSYAVSGTYIAISFFKPTKKFIFFASIPEEYFQLSLGRIEIEESKDVSQGKRIKIKDLKDVSTRASFPSFSPDNKFLVYVKNELDSRNIFVYDIEKGKEYRITKFLSGQQFTFPKFSHDGKFIIASYFDGKSQDIVLIPFIQERVMQGEAIYDKKELIFITQDKFEDRDPQFVSAEAVAFSSDRDGVFNIYVKDLKSGETWKVTEEISSALFADFSTKGVLYVSFEPEGFRVRELKTERENWIPIEKSEPVLLDKGNSAELDDEINSESIISSNNYFQPKSVGLLNLSSPLFVPILGLTLTPFLTGSAKTFFLPLDIFGLSFQLATFDRLGRAQILGDGFLGIRGSWSLTFQTDLIYFKDFIPSLFFGALNIKAVPLTTSTVFNLTQSSNIFDIFGGGQIIFPILYGAVPGGTGVPARALFLSAGAFGEIYSVSSNISGFFIVPFSQSFSARSINAFIGANSSLSFPSPIGGLSLLAAFRSTFFSTSIDASEKQFDISQTVEIRNYQSARLEGGLGLAYTLPIALGQTISLRLFSSGGYTLQDVEIFDEFRGTSPGYFLVFFGDWYLRLQTISTFDLWYGYVPLFSTFSLNKFSVLAAFDTFRFAQKGKSLEAPIRICSGEDFLCSVYGGFVLYGNLFYRYGFAFQMIFARGLQDPLKAPVRIYFGLGLGL